MTPKDRSKLLTRIWKAFTTFAILIIIFGGANFFLLAGLAITTLLATLIVSLSRTVDAPPGELAVEEDEEEEKEEEIITTPKAKRSDMALVDRLIGSMSESELAALRRRLNENAPVVGDDGEMVSLDELLASKKKDESPFEDEIEPARKKHAEQ